MEKEQYGRRTPAGARLRPLLDAMREDKVSVAELASRMKVERYTVHRWIRLDDVSLSKLEAAFRQIGYKVRLTVSRMGEEATDWKRDGTGLPLARKHEPVRLMPLYEAIFGQGYNLTTAAEQAKVIRQTLWKVFVKDDANLSVIWKFAEAIGCEARLELTRLEGMDNR